MIATAYLAGSNMLDNTKHWVATETVGLPAIGDACACAVNCKALTAACGNSKPVPKLKNMYIL